MDEIDKIIRRVLESPRNVIPSDLCRLLEHYGYTRRKKTSGGSHLYYFTKKGCPPIHFPRPHHGKAVNIHYVRAVARLLRLEIRDEEE